MNECNFNLSNVINSILSNLISETANDYFKSNCINLCHDLSGIETDVKLWFNSHTLEKIVELSMEYNATLTICNIFLYGEYNYNEVVESLIKNLTVGTLTPTQYQQLTADEGEIQTVLKNNRSITTMVLLYIVLSVKNISVR